MGPAPLQPAILDLLDEGADMARRLEPALAEACQTGQGSACAAWALALQLVGRVPEAEEAARLAVVAGEPGGRWIQGRIGLSTHGEWQPARRAFEEACRQGYPPACHDLGVVLQADDQASALALQERACRQGFGPSCHALAARHREGGGVVQSRLQAAFLDARACRLGHGRACRAIGAGLAPAVRAFPPLGRWLESLERPGTALLCERGRAWACTRQADLLAADPATLASAAERIDALYRQACEQGDPAGCGRLGARWAEVAGRGAEALGLLERACDAGRPEACAAAAAHAPTRARALRERACRLGSAPACLELAWAQAEGRLPGATDAQAVAWLEQSCDQGEANACALWGRRLIEGRGTARDEARAIEVLQRACEIGPGRFTTSGCEELAGLRERACSQGSARACVRLGRMARAGLGIGMDDVRAAALFERACRAGEPIGCLELGLARLEPPAPAKGRGKRRPVPTQGPRPAAAEGIALLRQACAGLAPAACLELWRLAEAGRLPGASQAESDRLLRLACDVRSWPACEALGDRQVRAHEPVLAAGLYQHACRGGEPTACRKLAMLYLTGAGGAPLDRALALGLLGQACEQGDAEACCGLSVALAGPEDTPPEFVAGLVEVACDGGAAACCTRLGQLHLEGRGVPVDPGRAWLRFGEGCVLGDPEGCAEQAALKSKKRKPRP
jgi:hypothetical protein